MSACIFIIRIIFLKDINRSEGMKKPPVRRHAVALMTRLGYVSVLSSIMCAKFQEQSTPEDLRAIGNPKMYKPARQFSPPRVRKVGIVEERIITAARSFSFPQRSTLPLSFFEGRQWMQCLTQSRNFTLSNTK